MLCKAPYNSFKVLLILANQDKNITVYCPIEPNQMGFTHYYNSNYQNDICLFSLIPLSLTLMQESL